MSIVEFCIFTGFVLGWFLLVVGHLVWSSGDLDALPGFCFVALICVIIGFTGGGISYVLA